MLSAAGFGHFAALRLCLNLSLFDLLVICEMLDHPSEVLHYLKRRTEIEKGEFLGGDETDLLGFYLRTGFNLGEAEFEPGQFMQLFGLSDSIDTYHYRLEAGLDADKPRMRRTDWWEDLLATVEARAGSRWAEVGPALCNVAFEDQQAFEQAFTELQDTIRTGSRPANDYVLFTNGPPQRRDYFAGFIATQETSQARREQMDSVARAAMGEKTEIQRLIIIGWPPERNRAPYQVLGVLDRPTN